MEMEIYLLAIAFRLVLVQPSLLSNEYGGGVLAGDKAARLWHATAAARL
jgi:hypothetical protein